MTLLPKFLGQTLLPLTKEKEQDNLAYHYDIPGQRCGPEDGPWPRKFQALTEEQIEKELALLAKPQTTTLDTQQGWKADSLNFQPCPSYGTQDRYVVQQLDIHGQTWTLTGVFDGHLGVTTVEHTRYHLPIIVRDFLRDAVGQGGSPSLSPEVVSEILSLSISSFDDAIASDVLKLFPGGLESLSDIPDEDIRRVINDQNGPPGSSNYDKARLCMYGTTAIVALVDPRHENLWVANLGDCQAILVSKSISGYWSAELLTDTHNGDNEKEVARVRREHPRESECVVDGRVLGAIAPFRCIGDTPFKQPPEFTRRILYNLYPGFHDTSPWEEFLVRNRTPPYISSQADVVHCKLNPSRTNFTANTYLVLCSDGLTDLCDGLVVDRIEELWARDFVSGRLASGGYPNLALRLLRYVIGDRCTRKVSKVLTLDMDSPWIDDTSIIVQTL
ncbi:protein serine/threonine phosphatase 2C [Neolentinus lepideus HHB14362 ss-1]|uniref:Protein serine/threonine phosphatase 2C n=1 Tax=Neolentinus lepideus HHB14362 ss-1 TaxID=1314782 RepID=A0A165RLY0_9AGAM|nr:protein serine/threonine phosphatase 2C [Neolentinus lepideus HHB14362 ss-1]